LLIKRGQLKKRVTIIPLNKVAARKLTPSVVSAAEKIVGKENVTHAIQLVGYEKEVEAAMDYVFGSTLVCSGKLFLLAESDSFSVVLVVMMLTALVQMPQLLKE